MNRRNVHHLQRRLDVRQRGAAAILAMLFLVIFSALAAAMAIVSEGNLTIADTNLRASRAMASAETGMQFISYTLSQAAIKSKIDDGQIDSDNIDEVWDLLRSHLDDRLHDADVTFTYAAGTHRYEIGPVSFKVNQDGKDTFPAFSATITRTLRDGGYYAAVRVTATDDRNKTSPIQRSVSMDFRIEKKIRFAILSKNRVMIGRNVIVEGPIGSRFMEVDLPNGHPIQMESDFLGLHSDLNARLKSLRDTLGDNDQNGDNRLDVSSAEEMNNLPDMLKDQAGNPLDYNSDGYVDDYDLFMAHFDANKDGKLSATELDIANHVNRRQLFELIDRNGDGVIDEKDNYAKIRGQVQITASMDDWNAGAGDNQYQDYFQGPIHPGFQESALTFNASDDQVASFEPDDFSSAVASLREKATGDLNSQAVAAVNDADPSDPDRPVVEPPGAVREAVPYGAANPYDYYDRPVYRNMTFKNVTIPKGTNALFINCTFEGVTFVETEVNNNDPDNHYNYNGMMDSNGNLRHRDKAVTVNGVTYPGNDPNHSTKNISNNIRFHNCTFEGAVASSAPQAYTQVRNKLNFTGNTEFKDLTDPAQTPNLTDEERSLYRRSTVLTPHMSVEMGTFEGVDNQGVAENQQEKINLSGTIVAGVIDLRGQVDVLGTILTTFEPVSDQGPVLGKTSPNFNTTLGYFSEAAGDLEMDDVPGMGIGRIRIRYDPTLPLPDGINAPISLTPVRSSYREGGA